MHFIRVILGCVLLTSAVACATPDGGASVYDGPLPQRFPTHLERFEAEYRAALAGDCAGVERLLARDLPVSTTAERGEALRTELLRGQLYDQGLCRPYDPAAAYRAFLAAEAIEVGDYPVLSAAWKLWHGHGVARDVERARRRFATWAANLSRLADLFDGDVPFGGIAESELMGRPMPEDLRKAVAWGHELVGFSDVQKTEFALAMFKGEAPDWRGERVPASTLIAKSLIFDVFDTFPEAQYLYGLAAVRGELPGVTMRDGKVALSAATRNCIEGSFTALAQAYEATAAEGNRDMFYAYELLLFAERKGFDVSEERARIGRRLDDVGREIAEDSVSATPDLGCTLDPNK